MTDEEARIIRTYMSSVEDVLRAAASIADRASDALSGKEGMAEFHAVARVISGISNHPAILAVKSLGVPPDLR